MVSFRFCRSDDIPLLVEAYNGCYQPHFPELPELTVPRFKGLIKSHDIWTSSCMVAQDGDDPVAVLFSAKRDEASLIYCVGVHASHQRRGHARHLMTSLSQKLAILGPPLLQAEVSVELAAGRALLQEGCGYTENRIGRDLALPARTDSGSSPADNLVAVVTPEELVSHGALEPISRPWLRRLEAFSSYGTELQALAVVSEVSVEAHIAYWPGGGEVSIVAFGARRNERRLPLLALLLDRVQGEHPVPLVFRGVSEQELSSSERNALGFLVTDRVAFYSVMASPA